MEIFIHDMLATIKKIDGESRFEFNTGNYHNYIKLLVEIPGAIPELKNFMVYIPGNHFKDNKDHDRGLIEREATRFYDGFNKTVSTLTLLRSEFKCK